MNPLTRRDIRARLAAPAPALLDAPVKVRASVALVLRNEATYPSLLLIRRAEFEGDRWSGHIAFPGGRAEAGEHPRAVAERETREELGIDLTLAEPLGRLDDLGGTTESIRVSAFVYGLLQDAPLRPNHEVAQAFWMDLDALCDPGRHVQREFPYTDGTADATLSLPAIRVLDGDAPVLWGLSYRFLELLLARLGHEIPSMPWRPSL